jgi:glycerol-3-phosphate O-acyltransferase
VDDHRLARWRLVPGAFAPKISTMSVTALSSVRVQRLVADPRFPSRFARIVVEFFANYRQALIDAGLDAGRYDHLLVGFVDRMAEQLDQPFVFEPYHQQILAPFDYYSFGVEFLRPLVDRERSTLQGRAHLDRIGSQLAAGDNVIFLANHQTEGDPQAISLLLEPTHPDIGREMIFAAGERVTTDPMAVPFSMGRNLLCIYSKRYIDHPPDQRHTKQQHNRRTMERMSELLASGGRSIYVAPSGGRDRATADGVVEVAPFDPQSVEMFYLMASRSGRPAHFYPMALATYHFLPPPEQVQQELGEARSIRRTGIHLAIGAEVDMERFPGSELDDRHGRRAARARHIWELVREAHAAFPDERDRRRATVEVGR